MALIERVVACDPGRGATAEIRLHPLEDPFLTEHRLRGRPTLPLVVALEAFAETARLAGTDGQAVVGFRDVEITDAVRFFTDEPTEIRVTAEMTESGVRCRLTHDFRNRRGQMVQKDRLHFSGVVERAERPATIEAKPPQLPAELFEVDYPENDEVFYHGPPLRLLKRIKVSSTGAVGEICLPSTNELCRPPRRARMADSLGGPRRVSLRLQYLLLGLPRPKHCRAARARPTGARSRGASG